MSEKDLKSNSFVRVASKKDYKLLLSDAAKTFAPTTVWTKNQGYVVYTQLTAVSFDDELLYVWIPKEFDLNKFRKEINETKSTEVYFSLSLASASIFFKTDFIGFDSAGLKFSTPKEIFKVQRRKDFRLPIPEGYVIYAEFKDPVFTENTLKKKVLDISAGGLALLGEEGEIDVFKLQMIIKGIEFKIKNKSITADGEVRYARKLSNNPRSSGIKIGIQFTNLKPTDAQHIAAYVFEEGRKYFTKYF